MKSVTVKEFLENFDRYYDLAKNLETVKLIGESGEPEVVLISHDVYLQARKGNRQALHIEDLPDEDVKAILEDDNDRG